MLALLKLKSNIFSGAPKLPLIPKVGALPKKLFLWLSEGDDELLSTPKIIIFLAVSLSKLQKPALSNVILYPLYHSFLYDYFLLY